MVAFVRSVQITQIIQGDRVAETVLYPASCESLAAAIITNEPRIVYKNYGNAGWIGVPYDFPPMAQHHWEDFFRETRFPAQRIFCSRESATWAGRRFLRKAIDEKRASQNLISVLENLKSKGLVAQDGFRGKVHIVPVGDTLVRLPYFLGGEQLKQLMLAVGTGPFWGMYAWSKLFTSRDPRNVRWYKPGDKIIKRRIDLWEHTNIVSLYIPANLGVYTTCCDGEYLKVVVTFRYDIQTQLTYLLPKTFLSGSITMYCANETDEPVLCVTSVDGLLIWLPEDPVACTNYRLV